MREGDLEAAMIVARAFTKTEPWLPLYSGREAAEFLQRAFQPALGLDGIIAGLMPLESARDMVDRMAGSVAAENVRLSRLMIESLNPWPWRGWPEVERRPRRQPYVPEPERPPQPIEAVQIDSQITLEGLSHALAEGRLPVRDVMRLCLRHVPGSKPGVKEPPIEEQLALVEGWYTVKAARGRKRSYWEEWEKLEGYCNMVGISRATLHRYEKTCKALGLL